MSETTTFSVAEIDAEIGQRRAEIEALQKTRDGFRAQIGENINNIKTVTSLRASIRECDQEIDTLGDRLKYLERERVAAQRRDLIQRRDEMLDKCNAVYAESGRVTLECEELTKRLAELASRRDAYTLEARALGDAVRDLESDLRKLDRDHSDSKE